MGRDQLLTKSDWLQIEMAARGCVSGSSDDWPLLRDAIEKLLGHPLPIRRPASWLSGFCEAVVLLRLRGQDEERNI